MIFPLIFAKKLSDMKLSLRGLKAFDWFLICGVLVCSITYAVLTAGDNGFDWLGTVSAVTGLFCVVLCAHGNIVNYFFGLVNVLTYAWISYKSNLLGDCALNLLYYTPMQFIGWAVWSRRKDKDDASKVYARAMNAKSRIVLGAVSIAVVALTGFLLSLLKGQAVEGSFIREWHLYSEFPYKDALTTMFAIIAQYLLARAFMEQWFFWIVMDVVSLAIWASFLAKGTPHAGLMVIMYVFYTANAVNGARIWAHLPRKEN